jgi:hypothetical protein
MNKSWKHKWLKALRSGAYVQGKGRLYNPKEQTFCCIGVLGDIAGIQWDPDTSYAMSTLPEPFMSITGLPYSTATRLAERNDNGWTFAEIADLIEATL